MKGQVKVIELQPIELLEKRMAHIVQLVDLAEQMGFPFNGFVDENDLLKKMEKVEVDILTDLICKLDMGGDLAEILKTELRLEKFKAIKGRILDAMHLY